MGYVWRAFKLIIIQRSGTLVCALQHCITERGISALSKISGFQPDPFKQIVPSSLHQDRLIWT